jgi:hypothetical protein
MPSCFTGRIGWKQQVSRSPRKLKLDAFCAFSAVRNIRVVQAAKMCCCWCIDRVYGPDAMFPRDRIYRFNDGAATKLPFSANVHDWFPRLACAMEPNNKTGLGQ